MSLDESVLELIQKREKTHGMYYENASLTQALKEVIRSGPNWASLTDGQREALDMICAKVSRVLCGDADFRDHWDDIAGYAKLGGEQGRFNLQNVLSDLEANDVR
jgi:hypothetical protein